jgi:transcriptional regulator with XRE-family HTH domain
MAERTGNRGDWIGLRVARWRDIAGMTQQQLADAIGVSREYISMIENGKRAVTKRSLLYDLAAALRVGNTDLTGQPVPPRSSAERAADLIAPVVRQALDGFDDPPQPRPLDRLAVLSDRAMSARMNADWPTLGDILPVLLAETAVLADETGVEQALALHVQACVTSAQALKSFGVGDLARRIVDRAAVFADRLGDPVHIAAAQFVTAQTVLAGGSRRGALAVAERAADRLQPDVGGDDSVALYGMLHLSAALSAASVGRVVDAQTHLDEAADVAPTVAGDPWRMEFTPANVAVWRVAVALENASPSRRRGTRDRSTRRRCERSNGVAGCTSTPAAGCSSPASGKLPYVLCSTLTPSGPNWYGSCRWSGRSSGRCCGTVPRGEVPASYVTSRPGSASTRSHHPRRRRRRRASTLTTRRRSVRGRRRRDRTPPSLRRRSRASSRREPRPGRPGAGSPR